MRLFRNSKKTVLPNWNQQQVSRSGKKRVNQAKVGRLNRSYNKSLSKLKRSGFKITGAKPINRMTHSEYQKAMQKAKSGNYEIRTLTQAPKWVNESPREYLLLRRKKK
jgi:hypothetical protein